MNRAVNNFMTNIEWKTSPDSVPYPDALAFMDARVAQIVNGTASPCAWLLEHPAMYTCGTSAKPEDVLNPQFPVYESGRGGQVTYHGPGQRICYLMLNLREIYKEPDIKQYIWQIEECVIRTLAHFGVVGERRAGRVGIWVVDGFGRENKIAAIGVRVRHWVAFHGLSVNLNPDLSHFQGIVPCGVTEHGVTSLSALGVHVTQAEFDAVLKIMVVAAFSHGV